MGLVQTNEKCVGCNRCIGVCPSVGANVAVEHERGNIIEIDPKKCIACGACIDACEHGAREYVDDVERFFDDLKRGEHISVLIAPAFLANYPAEYEKYLGMLKKLGVNRFISVSFNIQKIRSDSKNNSKKSAWGRPIPPKKRMEALNKQFAALNLDDFVRNYTDRSKECGYIEPDQPFGAQRFDRGGMRRRGGKGFCS